MGKLLRKNCIVFIFMGAWLGAASFSFAQTPAKPDAKPGASHPDLSGIWGQRDRNGNPVGGGGGGDVRVIDGFLPHGQLPPLKQWALDRYPSLAVHPGIGRKRSLESDPMAYCLPEGFPRVYTLPDPFEIVQQPNRILMMFESLNQVRRIPTDGRKLPQDPFPTYMGYSVGKWDGDTLVVETAGLTDITWLDYQGTPHSNALRVVERFRRSPADTLNIDFLFDDPKTFTKPWKGHKTYYAMPSDWSLVEFLNCELPKALRGAYPDWDTHMAPPDLAPPPGAVNLH